MGVGSGTARDATGESVGATDAGVRTGGGVRDIPGCGASAQSFGSIQQSVRLVSLPSHPGYYTTAAQSESLSQSPSH